MSDFLTDERLTELELKLTKRAAVYHAHATLIIEEVLALLAEVRAGREREAKVMASVDRLLTERRPEPVQYLAELDDEEDEGE